MKPWTLCSLLSCITVSLVLEGTATGQSISPGQGHAAKRSRIQGVNDAPSASNYVVSPHGPFDENLALMQKQTLGGAEVYVPDTVVERTTRDTSRHLYAFNSKGKRITDLNQFYRNGAWSDSMRQTATFDESGKCLTETFEIASSGYLRQFYRIMYTYDERGNLNTKSGQSLIYQWVDSWRTGYTYDGNDRMLTRLEELYSNGQWVYNSHSAYTYDAAGHVLTHYEFSGWNGTWINGTLLTYTYDAQGRMATAVFTMWSGTNWEDGRSTSYAYHDNGHLLSEWTRVRKYGSWYDAERVTYSYDPNWNLISKAIEGYDGGWTNRDWMTYYYDAGGKMTAELWQWWQSDHWVNEILWNYLYDSHGNLTVMSFDRWSNSIWTPDDAALIFTDGAGNDCEYFGYNITLTYSNLVTGIRAEAERECSGYSLSQNYPNPFNPTTTIRYGLPQRSNVILSIYNALGQLVSTLVNGTQEAGYHEARLDGSNLASGVYFYRLQAGSFVQTKRLLLVR